jgi:hypothetical protein
MSKDRSHLVPTQTVDKNGVLTTRHMNTSKPSASKQPRIPAITLAPTDTTDDTSVARLGTLIYGGHVTMINAKIIERLDESDKTATPLLVNLLTTGSEDTRSQVRMALATALYDLVTWQGTAAYSGPWTNQNYDPWAQNIKHKAISAWHAMSVIEETGRVDTPEEVAKAMEQIDWFLHPLSTRGDRSDFPTYWRGVAAAALSNVEPTDKNRKDAFQFPVWAGNHEDVARVIEIAKERQTFNIPTITEIMGMQDEAATPLRQGTL